MKVNLRYQNSFANDADININIVLTNVLFFTYVSDPSKQSGNECDFHEVLFQVRAMV